MKKLQVEIINLDHFGRGIAKKDKPIFIDNALVGEVVEIEITKDKKKYSEGKVINYIKKSPLRVKVIVHIMTNVVGVIYYIYLMRSN